KLLYGIGGIFPYTNLGDYIKFGLGFIFVLFFVGMIYTLIYTIFLVLKRKKEFGREFSKMFSENKNWFYLVFFIFLIIEIILLSKGFGFSSLSFFVLILIPFLYIYVKSVEKACMVNFVKPENLIEGDWLEREVKVNGKVIKKSVHGLSIEEIKILRKAGKKVLIKQGVPFTPAFLIAIILAGIYFFVL
ncbi:MAG: hypothetical protein U1E54_00430, partial [Candidatus Levybacteria bacterium]|nr:hypothetical protein [Candidatus Levybacteria bacterium]